MVPLWQRIDICSPVQGRIQDFKLGRRENFWGISCEKSRFYAKKSYFFSNFRGVGGRAGAPGSAPAVVFTKL